METPLQAARVNDVTSIRNYVSETADMAFTFVVGIKGIQVQDTDRLFSKNFSSIF